ncbi:MAG: hypothetical protein Q4G43_16640 [Mobilicoccus sp.]|nr:hypothetical protein [Mobilicoccus sp.]
MSIVAFVIAALLAASALSGRPGVVIAALVVPMVMLAIGWVPLLRLPSPRGTTVVQLLAVVVLLVPTLVRPEWTLAWLPGAVAVAMIASFVHQLVRRDARPRLVESVSASASGVALLSSAVCLVPLAGGAAGRDAIVAVMVATAAATLPDVGLGREPRSAIAYACAAASVVLGALAALGAHTLLGTTPQPVAVILLAGAMAGAGSYALRQIQSVLPSLWGRRAQFASAAGSVLCTGAVAYGLDWFAVLGP